MEQPLVSLSLYNGAIKWLMETAWEGPTGPFEKCMSGIGDHRFTFLIDLLPNYTFCTNLTTLSIGYLLREDVTSLITFNSWKVGKKYAASFDAGLICAPWSRQRNILNWHCIECTYHFSMQPALCLLQNQLCAVPKPAAPKPALCLRSTCGTKTGFASTLNLPFHFE